MTEFVDLIEHNDWEGETWHHYIPVEGNETEISLLWSVIDMAQDEDFVMSLRPEDRYTEDEVYAIVRQGGSGYLDFDTRLEGKLVLPPLPNTALETGQHNEDIARSWLNDHLYKGGIRDLMVEA